MKRIGLAGLIVSLSFQLMAQNKLMHYWDFNSLTGLSAAVDPSTIPYALANYSSNGTANIQYRVLQGTSGLYKTYWDVTTGDTTNARLNSIAGNCLRLRNPSDSMALLLYIPSSSYKNIRISYEAQKSSASNGAASHYYSYSTDSGNTWKTTGLSVLSNTVPNYSGGTPAWPLAPLSVTLSDSSSFNNRQFMFRITFGTVGTSGTSGNSRIDNLAIEGDTMLFPTITANGQFSPFSSIPGQFSTEQSFTISAVNLTDSLYVNAPNGFLLSNGSSGVYKQNISIFPLNGNIAATVFVKFNPQDTVGVNGNIVVSSAGASMQQLPVSGTTLPVPVIIMGGLPVPAFSNTQPSTSSAAYPVLVKSENLTDSIDMIAPNGFKIALQNNPAMAVQYLFLLPNRTDTVYVFFTPSSFGMYTDTLTLSNAAASAVKIVVSGLSKELPSFMIIGTPLDTFNDIEVGKPSAAKFFKIKGQALTGNILLTAPALFSLSIDGVNYTPALTVQILSGKIDTSIFVRCYPHYSGLATDTIQVSSADFSSYYIPVTYNTYNPFDSMTMVYAQDFNSSGNLSLPTGWTVSDTALWSLVTSNPSIDYPLASAQQCFRFDNEGTEVPKTATVTLSDFLPSNNFKDIKLIWGARRTNNFFNGLENQMASIMYSIDGITWDSVKYTAEPNNSNVWANINNGIPVMLPASANYHKDLRVRWQFRSEGLGSSGTYRFDDVLVFATPSMATGISSIQSLNRIACYPNPASENVTIVMPEHSEQELKVFDMLGTEVYAKRLKGNHTLSVSDWKEGIYIIRYGDQVQKLMIGR